MKTKFPKINYKTVQIFLIACLFWSVQSIAQSGHSCSGGSYGLSPGAGGQSAAVEASMNFDNSLTAVMVRNQAVVYGPNTIGSPYLTESFASAKITELDKVFLVRYNAFTDEMEVKQNELNVMILSKEKRYQIDQQKDNISFRVLEKVNDNAENELAYFIALEAQDQVSLYKKQCKKMVKRNKSTYGSGTSTQNTEFKDMRCEFYIEKNKSGQAIRLPKRKKDFLKLFPEKADQIASFMKDENIKLNKEASLRKLIKYINTI